jgi:uncharacterized membrane protein (DUF373 family)
MKFESLIDSTFKTFEYVVYIIVGFLLIATVVFLLSDIVKSFFTFPEADKLIFWVVKILDRTLLMLMFTEILYTVRLSIKEHTLYCEPFLIVGLIAAIRRVLVISVETDYQPENFPCRVEQ